MFRILSTLFALLLVGPSAHALIIGAHAPDATLGTGYITGTDPAASGGGYIVPQSTAIDLGFTPNSTKPDSVDRLATFNINFTQTGTYDLWVRYFPGITELPTNSDSLFAASDFGTQDVTDPLDWNIHNNLATSPQEWVWVNLSERDAMTVYVVNTVGDLTFQMAFRERGIRINGIAFADSDSTPTEEELNAAIVPEPAVAGLLVSMATLGFAMVRRRRVA